MDTSREDYDWVFLTNWQKRSSVRFSTKKKKDEAPAWLTSSVSWEKLQNTSVGGRKNFPLVVLDDTLGDNLIKWPLNLLWVKGDLNFLAWNTQQEVYERPRLGVPIVKPVPKNS